MFKKYLIKKLGENINGPAIDEKYLPNDYDQQDETMIHYFEVIEIPEKW